MEILALLVRRRGMLVTREEIVRTIWADGVHVDVDAGINTAIRKIRLALDDNSASPRYLETVIGKGYRFVGPIQVVENVLPSVASAPRARPRRRLVVALLAAGLATFLVFLLFAIRHPKPVLSGGTQGRVVVAVAPLENLSGDPRQDYFARGLTEEVITQLGQLKPERIAVVRYAPSMADPADCSVML